MKIRIITIHNIPNFGSVFQSYALCEYLKRQGYEDTKIVDYNPDYFNVTTLRSKIGKLLNFKYYKRRTEKFNTFIKKYIPLTEEKFSSVEQLQAWKESVDVYIAGGDQLWNVYHDCGNDDAYKLTWASGKKMSYGTSLGQTDFTDEQLTDLALKIRDFSAVSVRELSSVELLARKNIHATHCVDPVFLLSSGDYERFLKPIYQPKYILVYLVTPSELLERCIKYLSSKYGLKVILCSGFSKKCTCDEFLKDLGPDEILSYLKNAEMVLSSSFHATSFSLLFKKQFFTILPDEHTNERIISLLKLRGMERRIITENSIYPNALDEVINYDTVPSFEPQIEISKDYIKKALSNE